MSTNNLTVLQHQVDTYNSVVITDPITLATQRTGPVNVAEFERRLWFSLGEWRRKGLKGVWLKIAPGASDLISASIRCGFDFHHAEPEFLMMTAWVNPNIKNRLPPAAAHFVGCAGFVLNDRNELLVVREKTGPSANLQGFWKLPGGLIDRAEDISVAAVREVREETGIETEFLRIATIQEIHHGPQSGPAREGTSDLYLICVLRLTKPNQTIVPCPDEIAEAKFVPLDEVLNLKFYRNEGTIFHRAFRVAADVALGKSPGLQVEHLSLFQNSGIKNTLYVSSSPITSSKL